MFETIWMCTHEWSLISMRTTAFTFATCHQPLSCWSLLTRSITVRSFRFARTGTRMRIWATASAGVSRVSRSASSEIGCSMRFSVSRSRLIARESTRPEDTLAQLTRCARLSRNLSRSQFTTVEWRPARLHNPMPMFDSETFGAEKAEVIGDFASCLDFCADCPESIWRLSADSDVVGYATEALRREHSPGCAVQWRGLRGKDHLMDMPERAAKNEEVFRDINSLIEQGAERLRVDGRVPFHCECASASCTEQIELTPAEYDRIASHRFRFVAPAWSRTGRRRGRRFGEREVRDRREAG